MNKKQRLINNVLVQDRGIPVSDSDLLMERVVNVVATWEPCTRARIQSMIGNKDIDATLYEAVEIGMLMKGGDYYTLG